MAFGGGLAAGLPTALAFGEASLGIVFADFSTGAALSFGPADEDRGDFKGKALFFAPPCDVDLPLRLLLEPR